MKLKISTGKCIACSECVLVCPVGAINISGKTGKAFINQRLCTGCGLCKEACPVKAIKGG